MCILCYIHLWLFSQDIDNSPFHTNKDFQIQFLFFSTTLFAQKGQWFNMIFWHLTICGLCFCSIRDHVHEWFDGHHQIRRQISTRLLACVFNWTGVIFKHLSLFYTRSVLEIGCNHSNVDFTKSCFSEFLKSLHARISSSVFIYLVFVRFLCSVILFNYVGSVSASLPRFIRTPALNY